jgi:hypothetical protein
MSNDLSKIYCPSAIAYLDILGFRNLIRAGRADQALAALNRVALWLQNAKNVRDKIEIWPQVSMFSDSIAISVPLNREPATEASPAYLLLSYVQTLIGTLFNERICIRGAMGIGDLYHADPLVFGPALIDAVELENSAIYPRVILSNDFLAEVRSNANARMLEDVGRRLKRAKDGITSLRNFWPNFELAGERSPAKEVYFPRRRAILEAMQTSERDPRTDQKLMWLEADLIEDEEALGSMIVFSGKAAPKG